MRKIDPSEMDRNGREDWVEMDIYLPPDLDAEVEEAAKRNSRSFEAEILARLEMSVATPSLEDVSQQLATLKDMVKTLSESLKLRGIIKPGSGE